MRDMVSGIASRPGPLKHTLLAGFYSAGFLTTPFMLLHQSDASLHSVLDAATQAVMDLTGGKGADLVIEAVGSTATLSQSFHVARDEGQVVLFGLPEGSGRVLFDFDTWFRKRISAFTRLGAQDEPGLASFAQALDWIVSSQIDVAPVISHRFPGIETQYAFDVAQAREEGVVKVGLEF